MKKNFEDNLLAGGDIMRKTTTIFGENIGKAVALITGLLALLLTFADIAFLNFGTTDFTTELAVMLISSYIIYFSMEDAGERAGRESDDYITARDKYGELRGKVKGDMIEDLREFCLEYTKSELEYRRGILLFDAGYSEEEYKRWKSGEIFSKEALRVFRRIERLKPLKLTPKTLLSEGVRDEGTEIKNPERGKFIRLFMSMLPTTACTLFTASMVITARGELTPSLVIEGIVKLGCLPIIAMRAYATGYGYTKRSQVAWLATKSDILEAFISRECK